jgi:hypothetical protein
MAQETPQQYTQRILALQASRDPWKILSGTPGRLRRLLQGKTRSELARRPAKSRWSVNEIMAHLSETELVMGYRVRMILGQAGAPIQAFDQDVWAENGSYSQRDARASLELFAALRAANLALWKSLTPAQWKLFGIHSERGKESIEQIWRHDAGHDVNHLAQVEEILKPVPRTQPSGKRPATRSQRRQH